MSHARLASAALAAFLLTACPPPPLDPQPPTAAAARGSETVFVIEAQGSPLVVDWQPEHRGDLEVAMRDGVAVVGYDSKGLRLLKDCHIDGTYGFVGVSTKEQVIVLQSSDEVMANLPATGLSIVARVGAELGTSSEIDIAMVMVGKKRTTWVSASPADLKGECRGATHFIRGATVGAFALQSAARGQARATAELFGAGVTAGQARQRQLRSVDGSLDACRQASPDASAPPARCAALLRLDLVRLADRSPALAASKLDASSDGGVCPAGFVFAGGKCTKPGSAPHACKVGDVSDCTAQCQRGSLASCDTLGLMYLIGRGVTASDAEALKLFDKACTGKSDSGCFHLGLMVREGRGIAKSAVKGLELMFPACEAGLAMACGVAGRDFFAGLGVPRDRALGLKLIRNACNGGDPFSCEALGGITATGIGGIAKDERQARVLFKRACDGGAIGGCTGIGFMHETGRGGPKKEGLADTIYRTFCEVNPVACVDRGIALMYDLGRRKKDWSQAGVELRKGCDEAIRMGGAAGLGLVACVLQNELYGGKYRIDPELARSTVDVLAESCQAKEARDCTALAVVSLGIGKRADGKKLIQLACEMGDRWACELGKPGVLK
ncbi:MAG: sel1 repeat family protein [Polyangiaceae bacterium]|nr:sel1 repeat family protein [Polyangiaceae bacterium]